MAAYINLRKLALTVFKDQTIAGSPQVVAPGVDIIPLKKGVIANGAHSMAAGAGRTLTVHNAKYLAVNDVLQAGTDDSITATVTALPNDVQATVTIAGGTMTLADEARLLIVGPAGRVPTIYTDPDGTTSTATLTTDSSGYAQCYIKERQSDVLIGANSGGITASYRECETTGDDEIWISVANYATIQDAIDSVQDTLGVVAATVYMPPGYYEVPTTITITGSVRLVGAGVSSTVLLFDTSKNVDVLSCEGSSHVVLEHFSIGYLGTPGAGTGRGIVMGGTSGPIGSLNISNVEVYDPPSWGLELTGGSGASNYVTQSMFNRFNVYRPRSNGAVSIGEWSYVLKFVSCVFSCSGSGVGYAFYGANVSVLDLDSCELAPATNTKAVFIESTASPTVPDNRCIRINSCDIEGFGTAYGVHIQDARAVTMTNNILFDGTNAIHLEDCVSANLMGNYYWVVTTTDVTLTDCLNVTLIGERGASGVGEADQDIVVVEAGTTAGTVSIVNGVVHVPRYTTANLPTVTAGEVMTGALAYDTTTDTLKVVNNAGSWNDVP